MDADQAVKRWVEVWAASWRAHDIDPIAALYAEDCVYRSSPFRPPHPGREGLTDYVRWAFEAEREVNEVRFGSPIVQGDRASVEYWTTILDEQNAPATLAGCCVMRFGPDGKVSEARDYWHLQEGHTSPPPDWGQD
jgi:ketosteroid isomerase-like protein